MIAITWGVLLLLVLGAPIALLSRGSGSRASSAGLGLLFGSAATMFTLLMLSILGVRWSRTTIVLCLILLATILWVAVWKRGAPRELEQSAPRKSLLAAAAFDLMTLAQTAGYGLLATAAPQPESDFITIWGLKARVFWLHGGIDWGYLRDPFSVFAHPDYPLYLPLMIDFFAVLRGGWDDRLIGWFFAALGGAALLIVRSALREDLDSPVLAAAGTAALAALAFTPWLGLAEGPFVAYLTAGLLLVRSGALRSSPGTIRTGALVLGVLPWIKNEGMTLLVAVTIVVGLLFRDGRLRRVMQLWPAWALAFLWVVIKRSYGLTTPLVSGDVLERAAVHLRNFDQVVTTIVTHTPGRPIFWLGIVIILLLAGRERFRREGIILGVITLQIVAYVAAYLVTPYEIVWHIRWSWERLVFHLTLPIAFVAVSIALMSLQRSGESAGEAGSRSIAPTVRWGDDDRTGM